MSFELALFLSLGTLAIISAAGMIVVRNAVHSALLLVVNFGCIALLFLMLDAPFISMVQIAVYAGAIMVLFLFVIMLLGAEQTSDTSGGYQWITGAATILALAFVGILGGMAVTSGGLDLPEAPGADPMVRVVQAANLADPADITISGDTLADPLVIAGATFGDISEFYTVPQGDYTITVSPPGAVPFTTTVALAADEVVTAVAYGSDNFQIALVPSSFADGGTNTARVSVLNAYVDAPLTLVDVGRNAQLDTLDGRLRDVIVAGNLAYGTVSKTFDLRQGTYPLRFVQEVESGNFEIVSSVGDWNVAEGTEQLIILTPDFTSMPDSTGTYRARVLDRTQSSLVITTSEQFGSPKDIGQQLFTAYLLPVNLVGFLLLVALIGVIVLTRPAGLSTERRSTINRRRKVSRPLVSVIAQQTGGDVVTDTPRLEEPGSGD